MVRLAIPLNHAASHGKNGSDPVTIDGTLLTGNIPAAWLGATSTTAAAGNDSRITGALPATGGTFTGVLTGNVPASANYGSLSLGSGPWDGTTAGFFTGNAAGTKYGINSSGSFSGDYADWQAMGSKRFQVDYLGNVTLPAWSAPAAPTAALAGTGAGNVDNGTHVYQATYVNANGETTGSASSASVNVTDKTTNGKVTVTIAQGPPGTTGINVYRSKLNTSTPLFKVVSGTTITSNVVGTGTITYTDNIADASLTATQPPTGNATGGKLTVGPNSMTTDSAGRTNLSGGVVVSGSLNSNGLATFSGNAFAGTPSAGAVPFAAKGAASQTSDLIQANNNSNVTQFGIANTGSGASPIWAIRADATTGTPSAASLAQTHTLGLYSGFSVKVVGGDGTVIGWLPLYA